MNLKNIFVFALCIAIIASCGKKKKTMAGNRDVNLQEFVDFYPDITLPFSFSDSLLNVKTDDSLLIDQDVFNQFVPDSIWASNFGKEETKLYAIGKFNEKNGSTYLLSKITSSKRKMVFVSAYNAKFQYIAGFPVMKSTSDPTISTTLNIDKLYNFNIKTKKNLPNDLEVSGDNVYVLNTAAKKFILVMTDSLGDATTLINPIDTLSKTYNHAGDYGVGSRNIISIRDNMKTNKVSFFIHLEQKEKQCTGELKGEATIVSDNTIEYRQPGDPCVLQFVFSKNSVTLKEVSGCGSRMGALDCTFNGSYPKKKEVVKKK